MSSHLVVKPSVAARPGDCSGEIRWSGVSGQGWDDESQGRVTVLSCLPPSLTTHHLIGSICFYQSDYRLDWTGAGLLVFYAHHFHRTLAGSGPQELVTVHIKASRDYRVNCNVETQHVLCFT